MVEPTPSDVFTDLTTAAAGAAASATPDPPALPSPGFAELAKRYAVALGDAVWEEARDLASLARAAIALGTDPEVAPLLDLAGHSLLLASHPDPTAASAPLAPPN